MKTDDTLILQQSSGTHTLVAGSRSVLTMTPMLQDGISGWLCEEMTREGLEVDQMDVSGNTPLHLAAARGNTATAAALLNLGASVNMKVINLHIAV